MAETFAEYVTRLTGYLGDKDPMQVLRATPRELARLMSLPEDPRALEVSPAGGKWSVRQILAHMSEAELVVSYRLRKIASKNGATVEGYDQDRWAATSRYDSIAAEDSLELFSALRYANLRFLERLPAQAWENYGLHTERGQETIRQMSRLTAGHDLNHTMQISALVGTGPS